MQLQDHDRHAHRLLHAPLGQPGAQLATSMPWLVWVPKLLGSDYTTEVSRIK